MPRYTFSKILLKNCQKTPESGFGFGNPFSSKTDCPSLSRRIVTQYVTDFCVTFVWQNYFCRYVGRTLGNRYGAGTGPIWLDDLACTGRESHLFNCRHLGWGQHNCGHHEDVSINCYSSNGRPILLLHCAQNIHRDILHLYPLITLLPALNLWSNNVHWLLL